MKYYKLELVFDSYIRVINIYVTYYTCSMCVSQLGTIGIECGYWYIHTNIFISAICYNPLNKLNGLNWRYIRYVYNATHQTFYHITHQIDSTTVSQIINRVLSRFSLSIAHKIKLSTCILA